MKGSLWEKVALDVRCKCYYHACSASMWFNGSIAESRFFSLGFIVKQAELISLWFENNGIIKSIGIQFSALIYVKKYFRICITSVEK